MLGITLQRFPEPYAFLSSLLTANPGTSEEMFPPSRSHCNVRGLSVAAVCHEWLATPAKRVQVQESLRGHVHLPRLANEWAHAEREHEHRRRRNEKRSLTNEG